MSHFKFMGYLSHFKLAVLALPLSTRREGGRPTSE